MNIKSNNLKKYVLFFVGFSLLVIVALSIVQILTEKNNNLTHIRIGWQTTWATQGQLTEVLKNTDLLKQNGLRAEFIGFSSGAPLNEAALGGSVDIIFTADQPAATLLSKSNDWIIISRLMYNRVSLYVPPNSPIKTIFDLKGKIVGMPFGAAAQRMAIKAEKDAGLNPATDVTNINLGIYEQAALVKNPNAVKWDTVDALAGFDPTPAVLEEKGLIRNLKVEKVVSVILISKKYIKEHPNAPKQFLKAFADSYDYYRLNQDIANNWFVKDAKLNISKTALDISAEIEPNLKVYSKSKQRLYFNEEDYKIMQEAADFLFQNSMIKKEVNMKENIDLSYINIER